jgi:hypothetical protein
MLFWCIWAPPNGPKKVYKGPQVGRMHGLISWLENKPLTKSIPILVGEIVQNKQKIVFYMLFWGIWAPQMDLKRFTKALKGA